MQQVLSAHAMTRMNLLERVTRLPHEANEIPADAEKLLNEFFKLVSHHRAYSQCRRLDRGVGANST